VRKRGRMMAALVTPRAGMGELAMMVESSRIFFAAR
jgi:hypothetical protein